MGRLAPMQTLPFYRRIILCVSRGIILCKKLFQSSLSLCSLLHISDNVRGIHLTDFLAMCYSICSRKSLISSDSRQRLEEILENLTGELNAVKEVRAQTFPRADLPRWKVTQKGNDILLPKRQKKIGVTDFVLERTCPEKYPKSEKSGFDSW